MPDHHSLRRRARLPLVGFVLGMLILPACGDEPLTRTQARERAANAVCDYYGRCMGIGVPPATYTSRDDCLITWRANLDGTWPEDRCTTIIQTGLDLCIAAVRNQGCDNAGLGVTLASCSEANVCKAP